MSWTRVCSRLKGEIAQMTSWILVFAWSEAMQIVLAQSAREVSASPPGNLVRDAHIIQNLQKWVQHRPLREKFSFALLLLKLLTERTVDYEIYNTIQSCMYEVISQTSKYKITEAVWNIIQDKTIYRCGWTEAILYIYNLIWLGIKRLLSFMLSGTYYWAN